MVEADRLGMTSIAFPALGTGYLGYPPKLVASTMFYAVENFDKLKSKTSIKIVNCVVFAGDIFKVYIIFILTIKNTKMFSL